MPGPSRGTGATRLLRTQRVTAPWSTHDQARGEDSDVSSADLPSILLFNSKNELLLLHRVKTSSAFPSAHVFPGGTLSDYHETVPPLGSGERHYDGPAYRLAAIRETFEESGILLARQKGSKDGPLIHLSAGAIDAARKAIHGDKVRFTDWLDQIGGEPDVGGFSGLANTDVPLQTT